jgi:UPF0176 protein
VRKKTKKTPIFAAEYFVEYHKKTHKMPQLHNKYNRQELKKKMAESTEARITVSFYKYHHIAEPQIFRDELYKTLSVLGGLGRIYIANEGINAQMSMPEANKQAVIDALYGIEWLNGVRLNWAVDDNGKSFFALDVRVREKIVADGIDDPDFDPANTGEYLRAAEFNALYEANPNLLVVDMRNHYESEVGHIKGAILPDVDTFREQLPVVIEQLAEQKNQPIVMYCTGGIRCEKASAYLKHNGFGEVYHLEGGIIEYARKCKEEGLESKFIGKNFVFDDRLGERITEDIVAKCHQCGKPADTHTNCVNMACHLLFIQCAECAAKYENCCSDACQTIFHLPLEEQQALRKGVKVGRQVFKKGRF